MPIDLADIDEQIKRSLAQAERLQALKRILVADPDMVSTLNQVLASKNGHSTSTVTPDQIEDKANKKGQFLNKIQHVCDAFGTESFTVKDVVRAYEQAGYSFDAKDKAVSAYSALQRLISKGVIDIKQEGKGSRATIYRVVF